MPLGALLSGLAAVLLVVAVVGVALVHGFTTFATPTPKAVTGPSGTTAPGGGTTPPSSTAPLDDPLVGPTAVRAAFDTERSDLAPVGRLGPWTEVAGRWTQAGGTAAASVPGGDRSLAVVVPAIAPRVVQVTLATILTNSGLVVRYADPTHFVMLLAVPEQRSLWLAAVDGDVTRPELLGVASDVPLQAGMRIGVRLVPGRLTVVVNGIVARTVSDTRTGRGFGLVTGGAGTPATARFDQLVVVPG